MPDNEKLHQRILGINFFTGTPAQVTQIAVSGGLTVVPAGPALATDFQTSPSYRKALTTADLVITDSGWMVLLWWLFTGKKLIRTSGLELIRGVLQQPALKQPDTTLWIMPTPGEDSRNRAWLNANGFPTTPDNTYIAPFYGRSEINDPALLAKIEARKPQFIIVGLGGGVQERLGLWLRDSLSYRPSIICIGAAIAFLTGGQAKIPVWADHLYLGWLFRILHNPKKFWRRYYEALALAPLLYTHRTQLPPLKTPTPHHK